MLHIGKVAQKIGIGEHDLELYGEYKAKLKQSLWSKLKNKKDGKLILVSAINPTPAGEGKTTTSIGLAMAMNRMGQKTVLALREPSLGPCFGIKGGACGGGMSQIVPMEEINLHFTGDLHAITSANNLLASILDNHIFFKNKLKFDTKKIVWKRALDINDRSLRKIVIGLGSRLNGVMREDNFDITAASEIMAILCLAKDFKDLEKRLNKIIVGYDEKDKPIFAEELKVTGALLALLKDAIKPNLVQTIEGDPVIVHGGPFANIAHGCNSVLATRYGLKLGDYLVTEAGFGADLGAEKFFNIKCRLNSLKPELVVLVATIRSLKYNGGVALEKLKQENLFALDQGMVNLKNHLENIHKFRVPVLVALNHFPSDTQKEINFVEKFLKNRGIVLAVSKVWEKGSKGGRDLAEKALEILAKGKSSFKPLYSLSLSIEEKINKLVREIYGGVGVDLSEKAKRQISDLEDNGFKNLPICIAKTQYSFSDNPKLLGAPKNFRLQVSEVRVSNGAGFIVVLAGDISTMPGLPEIPVAEKINIDKNGVIKGLF